MRNPPGCITGCRLRNRTPSCATGRPDVLPESLPTRLCNGVGESTRLLNRATTLHSPLCNRGDFSIIYINS